MTVEETIALAIKMQLAPLHTRIDRLTTAVEALRKALPPALVPVREAAQALGVSEITIRRRISEGLIPTVRIGRSVRVDLAALRAPDPDEVARLANVARNH